MKKITLAVMLILTLLLTACGTQTSAAGTPAAETLPAAAELATGILKLQDTAQAVTAEQAAALLPLWQVYQSLTSSNTAAQAEVEALVEQIQGVLTSEQVQAIDMMGLTQQDMMVLATGQDITTSVSQPVSSSSSSTSGAPAGPEGGMSPSDMGGDPSMMGGEQAVSGSTTSSESSSTPAATEQGIPSALVSALIQLLESRAA